MAFSVIYLRQKLNDQKYLFFKFQSVYLHRLPLHSQIVLKHRTAALFLMMLTLGFLSG